MSTSGSMVVAVLVPSLGDWQLHGFKSVNFLNKMGSSTPKLPQQVGKFMRCRSLSFFQLCNCRCAIVQNLERTGINSYVGSPSTEIKFGEENGSSPPTDFFYFLFLLETKSCSDGGSTDAWRPSDPCRSPPAPRLCRLAG